MSTEVPSATDEKQQPQKPVDVPGELPGPVEAHRTVDSMEEAREALKPLVSFSKVIHQPVNFTQMQVLDKSTFVTRSELRNVLSVTWLCPMMQLQSMVHKRYQVEAVAKCSVTGQDLGLLTLTSARRIPAKTGSFINRTFLSDPHDTVSLSTIVVDRQHWRRTSWSLAAFNASLAWGKIPRVVYGIPNLYASHGISIDASLNQSESPAADREGPRYKVAVDGVMSISAEEGASDLFDSSNVTVPGFTDNESAMSVIGLPREMLSYGTGNTVFRQPMWSPLFNPRLAERVKVDLVDTPDTRRLWLEAIGGPLPLDRPPVAAWLNDHMTDCITFTAEMDVEAENEPMQAGAGQIGETLVTIRIANRAKRRAEGFKSEVRAKAYAELRGEQLPR